MTANPEDDAIEGTSEAKSTEEGAQALDRVGELMAEALERVEGCGSAGLEEVCREHPDLADPLRRRMAALGELGLLEAMTPGAAPEDVGEEIGDFRLRERVGSGGMGVVFRAEQVSLQREVALKLIRPDALHLPRARERFARETEIVARLQHPGIIPIYVVGGEDEVPYYAMELVRGCTLAEALIPLAERATPPRSGAELWSSILENSPESLISEAHEPGPLFAGSWEDTCLRIVSQVSEALRHAHQRGVLHRDLKPSNVMVTPGGRVMLLDFRLSHSEGSDTVTRSTDRIGSVPFMPPELIRDGPQAIDERSDVYELGVTLYQMLTLHLPYAATSVPATTMLILEGRPVAPRGHAPSLSWEAETVCLAAMDLHPDRRYATAEEFGRDIDRVLARMPIEARRAGFWLRSRRWIQRRPGEALAAVLLALLPVVAATLLVRENRNVNAALRIAETEEARAASNRDRALHAIDRLLVRLGDDELDHVPGMLGLRREILAEASELYHELLVDAPENQEVVLVASRCDLSNVFLLDDEGRHEDAERVARLAIARLAPFVDESPEARILTARLTEMRTQSLRALERPEDARVSRSKYMEHMRVLMEIDPDHVRIRQMYLQALGEAAALAGLNRENEEDLRVLEEVVREMRSLAEDTRDSEVRRALALALSHLGVWHAQAQHPEESIDAMQESLELYRGLLVDHPEDEETRSRVASLASAIAARIGILGRPEEAVEYLDIAAVEVAIVREGFPTVPEYQYDEVDILLNRGYIQARLGRDEAAITDWLQARDLLVDLYERHPTNAEYARTLGTILINIASTAVDLGRAEEALERIDEAREAIERAIELRPGARVWLEWLAIESDVRAKVLIELDRFAEAADGLILAAEKAGNRHNVIENALARVTRCLDECEDESERELVLLAAIEIVAIIDERGDFEEDARLVNLKTRLDAE